MSGGAGTVTPMMIEYGDPQLPDRYWEKVYPCPITGCWLWGAAVDKDGYGLFRVTGVGTRRAHRVSREVLVGPITEETLNHACRTPPCVNPNLGHAHEPMSMGDNQRHGKAGITHCPDGHPYDDENTWINNRGARVCRRCNGSKSSRYWHEVRKPALAAVREAELEAWLASVIGEPDPIEA